MAKKTRKGPGRPVKVEAIDKLPTPVPEEAFPKVEYEEEVKGKKMIVRERLIDVEGVVREVDEIFVVADKDIVKQYEQRGLAEVV